MASCRWKIGTSQIMYLVEMPPYIVAVTASAACVWNACEMSAYTLCSTWIPFSQLKSVHRMFCLRFFSSFNAHGCSKNHFFSFFSHNLHTICSTWRKICPSKFVLRSYFLVLDSFPSLQIVLYATCSSLLIWDTLNDLKQEENESSFNQRFRTTTLRWMQWLIS